MRSAKPDLAVEFRVLKAHPERVCDRRPQAPKLPKAAWINQQSPKALIQTA